MALKLESRGGEKKEEKEGGPRLSSARPWWDLCRGARYTAFRRGGLGRRGLFFHVSAWLGVINILKDRIFSPGLK